MVYGKENSFKEMIHPIIVIGVTHHNTLGMLRCIGMAGYHVDCLIMTDGKSNGFVAHSRFVKRTVACDSNQPVVDILKHYESESQKPIIITCTDNAASELDECYDEIKDKFLFFNAQKSGQITRFMDKQTQVMLAKGCGIKVPFSREYDGSLDGIPYPCLLKHVQSINGGKWVKVCNNAKEVEEAVNENDERDRVLVQEYIKKEYEIVVLGVSVNGSVCIPGYILKHREFDGGTNYSTVYPIDDKTVKLKDKCIALVKEIGYEGLFGVEFIFNGNDFYFIEINLRNDATTYAMAVAGVNLPGMYIKAKTESTLLPINEPKVRTIHSIVEFNDLKHRKQYGVSILRWCKELLGAKCKYYFKLDDPMPFFLAPFKNH